jgi:hypothetical protein
VLVHGLGLVELALALEIERQVVQVGHHLVAQRHALEPVEGRVELALALQRQAHHAVGLGRLLVGLHLAGFGDQEALGGERQVPDQQHRRRQHQLQPGRAAGKQAVLGPSSTRKKAAVTAPPMPADSRGSTATR